MKNKLDLTLKTDISKGWIIKEVLKLNDNEFRRMV